MHILCCVALLRRGCVHNALTSVANETSMCFWAHGVLSLCFKTLLQHDFLVCFVLMELDCSKLLF